MQWRNWVAQRWRNWGALARIGGVPHPAKAISLQLLPQSAYIIYKSSSAIAYIYSGIAALIQIVATARALLRRLSVLLKRNGKLDMTVTNPCKGPSHCHCIHIYKSSSAIA